MDVVVGRKFYDEVMLPKYGFVAFRYLVILWSYR